MRLDPERASAVVTALLADDLDLATALVRSDPDLEGLAFTTARMVEGTIRFLAQHVGEAPLDTWADISLYRAVRSMGGTSGPA